MINIALLNRNDALQFALDSNAPLVLDTIIKLIEHQSLVIRGKSILTSVLLLRNNSNLWFGALLWDTKFMSLIERLTKDSYKYVQYGLMHFIDQINETLPCMLLKLQDDLDKAVTMGFV